MCVKFKIANLEAGSVGMNKILKNKLSHEVVKSIALGETN